MTTRFAGSLTQVRTSSAVALAIWPPMRTPSLIAWPARSDLLLGRRRTVSDGEEVASLAVVGDAGVGTGVGVRDDSGAGVGSAGVTEADGLDAAEVPAELVAVTVKV